MTQTYKVLPNKRKASPEVGSGAVAKLWNNWENVCCLKTPGTIPTALAVGTYDFILND